MFTLLSGDLTGHPETVVIAQLHLTIKIASRKPMTELLARIEAILTETTEQQATIPEVGGEPKALKGHPLTNWTSDRIIGALVEELPRWTSEREQEGCN